MKDIEFYCPECDGFLIVEEIGIGHEVPCPICKSKIVIPKEGLNKNNSNKSLKETNIPLITKDNKLPPKKQIPKKSSPPYKERIIKQKLDINKKKENKPNDNNLNKFTHKFTCPSCDNNFIEEITNHTESVNCKKCNTLFIVEKPDTQNKDLTNIPKNTNIKNNTNTELPQKRNLEQRAINPETIAKKQIPDNQPFNKNIPKPRQENINQNYYPDNQPPNYPYPNNQAQNYQLPQNQQPYSQPQPNQNQLPPNQQPPNQQPYYQAPAPNPNPNPFTQKPFPYKGKPISKNPGNFKKIPQTGHPLQEQIQHNNFGQPNYRKARFRKNFFLTLIIILFGGAIYYFGYTNKKKKLELEEKNKSQYGNFIEENNAQASSIKAPDYFQKINNKDSIERSKIIAKMSSNFKINNILKKFFAAEKLVDKALLVRNSQTVVNLMLSSYASNPVINPEYSNYNFIDAFTENKTIFIQVEAQFARNPKKFIFLEYIQSNDSFLIDWKSYYPYNKLSINEFINGPEETPQIFRLKAKKDKWFGEGFFKGKQKDYYCLKLTEEGKDKNYIYGYAKKDSIEGKIILDLFIAKNFTMPAVKLKIPQNGKGKRIAEITQIVSNNWFIPSL